MHYNTVKDAALCTTLAVMTGFFKPRDAPEAFLVYIGLFVIMLFTLETARDWQKKNALRRQANRAKHTPPLL